jgi:glycosyltransferase involved in cell wall biosynthesis
VKIAVIGSKQENLGYGRMTLEIRSALERQGCEVVDENTPEVEHVLYITHPSRPEGWYKGQNVNLFSMWETTELAFEHLTSLPLYDRILVPCEANREIFSKVNDNVVTVPLGCDYDLYSPIRRTQSEPFVVLTAGRGALRKGFDVALRVFLKFSERLQQDGYPKPRLIIKGDAELSKNYDNVIVLDEKLSPKMKRICLLLPTSTSGCPVVRAGG